ncbi:MAG: DUF1064 domain-containing protein [Erysipelotrichaceae bacterium]
MINYPTKQHKKNLTEMTNLQSTKPRSSKYKSEKTMIDGILFDSKKEANRYCELKLLEQNHLIKNLKLQQPYVLIEKSKYGGVIKYIADFVYEENGKQIVEDTKGFRTRTYCLKKRMMMEKYGIEITET